MVTITLYVREQETQMYRTVFETLWEKARVGWSERITWKRILSYVKHIASPGSMHDTACSDLVYWDDPEGCYGEGGGRWGSGWGTHINPWLIHVKKITSPGSIHETGCSGLVHWDDPEGRYGREEGGGFGMGNTCTLMADSCLCMAKPVQYCKVINLQLK